MYQSKEFTELWLIWKQHKQEKTGYPYTEIAERMALSSLFKKSHGVEQLAIDSIIYSIESNWTSIYIKPRDNGQPNNGATGTSFRDEVKDAFSRRYQNGQ